MNNKEIFVSTMLFGGCTANFECAKQDWDKESAEYIDKIVAMFKGDLSPEKIYDLECELCNLSATAQAEAISATLSLPEVQIILR